MIAIHTIVKGVVWEMTGVIGLVATLWLTTGNLTTACNIGIAWPLSRVIMWPIFDWAWKRYCRRFYCVAEVKTNEVQETK